MKIQLAKSEIQKEIPNLEHLIREYNITGHVAIMNDMQIYFVIDELKKKVI